MEREARRRIIISAAIRVAMRDGIAQIGHAKVAAECKPTVTARTVRRVVGDRMALWREVAARARDSGMVRLVAEAETLGI